MYVIIYTYILPNTDKKHSPHTLYGHCPQPLSEMSMLSQSRLTPLLPCDLGHWQMLPPVYNYLFLTTSQSPYSIFILLPLLIYFSH